MKIIHLVFSFNLGGAETMLIDILNEQSKDNDVSLIIINNSYNVDLLDKIDKKVSLYFIVRQEGSRSMFPLIKLNFLLFRLKPQIIHSHQSAVVKLLLPIFENLVLTVHGMGVSSKYFDKYKIIFAISKSVAENILIKGDYNVVIIPNGINTKKIEYKTKSHYKDTFKIIQVARLDAQTKGQDILIKSLAKLKMNGYKNIFVTFIGGGSSYEELKSLSFNKGIDNQIEFLGVRDRDYIYKYLKDYDLMCYPARFEGFGLTVAEAMAAKLPVLVATGDGPYEIIGKGKYGYYFENENVNECAKMILSIISDYKGALMKADLAYEHVVKNYSVNKMVNSYLNQYENINA